jgi:hypothetical protein
MRKGLTHFGKQLSRTSHNNPFQSLQALEHFTPVSQLIFQTASPCLFRRTMSSPQDKSLPPNGTRVIELAIPGGAPLRVKNSLSKEKACHDTVYPG